MNSLVFDHTYISVPEDLFEKFKSLTQYFTCCKLQQVRSGDDMWEGIYFNSSNLSYIELINEKYSKGRNGGLAGQIAIAIHSKNPNDVDVDTIVQIFPNLTWNVTKRVRTDKRIPWFDAYSNYGENKNSKRFNPYFRSWAMKYHTNHPNTRISEMAKGEEKARVLANDLIGINAIHYEVVSDFFDYLMEGSKWFPKSPKLENNVIQLQIPDREGKLINFFYKISESLQRNKISKIEFYRNPNHSITAKEVETEYFSVTNTGNLRNVDFNF